MTEYPVQCFSGDNGEPYGRYVMFSTWYNGFGDDIKKVPVPEFPFPSGTIGKTYERDEVEVVSQINRGRTYGLENEDWQDTKKINPSNFQLKNKEFRQIFRLISQPVEKEPETVERLICGCGKQDIKVIDVWQPFAPYHDTVICKACWNKFIDWQKQQSK